MMKTGFLRGSMAAFIGALCAGGAIRQSQDGGTAPVIGRTYAESREGVPPAPQDVQRLPNIVWILLDDAGFGASKEGGPNDSLVSELGGGAKPAVSSLIGRRTDDDWSDADRKMNSRMVPRWLPQRVPSCLASIYGRPLDALQNL